MEKEVRDFITEAVNAVYKNVVLENYSFDLKEEVYDIELYHKDSGKTIRIGFRDGGKKRNFDVIPLHAMNAPLGLIEIFTSMMSVYWNAKEKKQTMQESLSDMISSVLEEFEVEEEKLVQ